MRFVLTKILGGLLTPGAILLLGLAGGCFLLWTRQWRRGRLILTLLLAAFVILTITPVNRIALETLESRFPANPDLPRQLDGIIILGGAVDQYQTAEHHQTALNDAAERMVAGAVLARLHPEARVVVSGGAADPLRPEPKEAPAMAALLGDMGIDPSRIVQENQSRNTFENAVFTQRLLQPAKGERWVLITSARHLPRAVGCFRAVGWSVIPYPVDYVTGGNAAWVNGDMPTEGLRRLGWAAHEWLGLLFYRLSGWTDNLFPGP